MNKKLNFKMTSLYALIVVALVGCSIKSPETKNKELVAANLAATQAAQKASERMMTTTRLANELLQARIVRGVVGLGQVPAKGEFSETDGGKSVVEMIDDAAERGYMAKLDEENASTNVTVEMVERKNGNVFQYEATFQLESTNPGAAPDEAMIQMTVPVLATPTLVDGAVDSYTLSINGKVTESKVEVQEVTETETTTETESENETGEGN